MSTPTSTADATVIAALTALPALASMMIAGKLSGLNSEIQGGIAGAESAAENAIGSVQTKLDALETSNPVVVACVNAARQSLAVSGLALPTEAQVFNAFKHAVSAFADGLKAV